ncbi:MAG: PDZ domain-containing protein, partial [bacterium]|nr:PDZ domain-containing protein [bacterium]
YSVDPASPAAQAGLRRGDRLTHVDGLAITSPEGSARFFTVVPGKKVRLSYERSGRASEIELIAEERPSQRIRTRVRARARSQWRARLEELGRELTEQLTSGSAPSAEEIREEIRRHIDELVAELDEAGAGVPPEGDKWGVPPEGDKWEVPVPASDPSEHNLRYAGTLGDTDLEVRGSDSVEVTVDAGGERIFIRTGDATIRLSRAARSESSSNGEGSSRKSNSPNPVA